VLPIRVVVSEPDAVSRRLICSLLECESGMTVTCVDDSRLVSSIEESAPDLVILDVHTPAIRCAPSWEAVGIKCAPATIVTAYDPAALTAFASSAVDLLVKPFDVERFETALDLAKSRISRARIELKVEERSSDQEEKRPARHFLQRLAVEANEKIVLVRVDDIRWMQSSGNYIRLHVEKTSHLVRQSMKNLQALLDPNRFLRVHRNAIPVSRVWTHAEAVPALTFVSDPLAFSNVEYECRKVPVPSTPFSHRRACFCLYCGNGATAHGRSLLVLGGRAHRPLSSECECMVRRTTAREN
jgi:two-component system LytT family response regulator